MTSQHSDMMYKMFCLCFIGDAGDSASLSNGAVIAIVCVIIVLFAAIIIIFIVSFIFAKRKFSNMPQDTTDKQLNAVIYDEEPVCILSDTSNKADVKLQPNPANDTSHDVVMDTNPAYESCI